MFQNCSYIKKVSDKSGRITFSRRRFFVSQCRKLSYGNLSAFQKVLVIRFFMHRRGVSHFIETFVSQSSEKFFGENLLFQECSGMEKVHGQEGGYHVFPSSFVYLTEPKRFVGEPLCNSEISSNEELHA